MCTVASSCLVCVCVYVVVFSLRKKACFHVLEQHSHPLLWANIYIFFCSDKLCAILTMQKGQPNTWRHPRLPFCSLSSKHGSVVSVLLSKHTANPAPDRQIGICYLSAFFVLLITEGSTFDNIHNGYLKCWYSFHSGYVEKLSLPAVQSGHTIKLDSVLTGHCSFYPKETEPSRILTFFRWKNSITAFSSFYSFPWCHVMHCVSAANPFLL